MNKIASLSFVLALSACANPSDEPIQEFVARAGAGMRGDVPQLPRGPAYDPVPYTAGGMRDPFDPGATAPPRPRPDDRMREALEAYGLETLRFTGVVERAGNRIALVRSPDGLLHRVQAGSYLGLASGRVVHVGDTELQLVEPLADGEERVVRLTLAGG